jgi:CheY-like chemotaxis protein
VLVVDDEVEMRELLRDVFEEEGFRVLSAANGREALDLLHEKPDCVVLDIHMPVMNGVELHSRMRADPAHAKIPVIITTSDPAQAPGGALIMTKPVDVNRLLRAVRAASGCPARGR